MKWERNSLELLKRKQDVLNRYLKSSATKNLYQRNKSERKILRRIFRRNMRCSYFNEENLWKNISENYDSISQKYKDKDGYWIGFEVSPLSLLER